MKISINQPAFLPWVNYFKRISEVDIFVLLDDVQYEKNSFINRNKIKNQNTNKDIWLTIPLKKFKFHSENNVIKNLSISSDEFWKKKQLKTINQNLSKQKNFSLIKNDLNKIYEYNDTNLCNFLIYQLKIITKILKINTKIIQSSDLNIERKKSFKIFDICKKLNADEYVSGPEGKNYLDKSLFKDKIKITYFNNSDIYESFDKEIIQYSIIQSFSYYGNKVIKYFDEK